MTENRICAHIKTPPNAKTPSEIYHSELVSYSYKEYRDRMFYENELADLAHEVVANQSDLCAFLHGMFKSLATQAPYSKALDWNIGSTVQHFDPRAVIDAFKASNPQDLLDSIGLTWVFGQLGIQDEIVIDYLYEVVDRFQNPEAWWRAGFSLERLHREEALTFLKRVLKSRGVESLPRYLESLSDKRSVVGILLLVNSRNIQEEIYPSLKSTFMDTNETLQLINCVWLLGRLGLIDREIAAKVHEILETTNDYELIFYTCQAIQGVASPAFLKTFEQLAKSGDPLLRRMGVRGMSQIDNALTRKLLEDMLREEQNPSVVSEITKGVYRIANANTNQALQLRNECRDIENGLIIDDTDKWYADPAIYDVFSRAEDPNNLALSLILRELENRGLVLNNPVDLATGTGRAIRFFLDNMSFSGRAFVVDRSQPMLAFLETTLGRRYSYILAIEFVNSTLAEFQLGVKSNFIFSSFGFPSRITNRDLAFDELANVYAHLEDDGLFVTLGWDETFNDGLSGFWYRYIADESIARYFEGWRSEKKAKIVSPRNCDLTWFKTGINVPLQFGSLRESAKIMGYLFGRDAADHIIDNKVVEWSMSLGITLDTKEEIGSALEQYETTKRK